MIITDLDGTLLSSDKNITNYTAEVLRCCRECGIKTAFATARAENSAKRFTRKLSPDAIISNGGALARFGDKIVYSCVIPQKIANSLIISCLESPAVGYVTVETITGDYFVNLPFDPNGSGWKDYSHGKFNDFSQGLDCDIYKMAVEFKNREAPQQIARQYSDIDLTSYTGESWYQFHNKNATKWNAIKHLIEYMKLSVADVAAFGDDYNDIDMLRECGVGIAVDNAIGDVKSVADFICDTNDNDGIAKWIEKYILSQ